MKPVYGSDFDKSRFKLKKGWRGAWHVCRKCRDRFHGLKAYLDHLDACYRLKVA